MNYLREDLTYNFHNNENKPTIWQISKNLVSYPNAIKFMQNYIEKMINGAAPELVWLLEHPPIYTAGTSAKEQDLLQKDRFPVFATGRGGQYTYHGPGQRIAYVMLDLKQRNCDVRAFIAALEQWIINSLGDFSIKAERREDRVGVWVTKPEGQTITEKKIAAIGIRLKKWVSYHGIAINLSPDLEHYEGIIACGQKDYGITSFKDLQIKYKLEDFDVILRKNFEKIFGPSQLSTKEIIAI